MEVSSVLVEGELVEELSVFVEDEVEVEGELVGELLEELLSAGSLQAANPDIANTQDKLSKSKMDFFINCLLGAKYIL